MTHPVAQLGIDGQDWLRSAELALRAIVDRYAFAKAIATNNYNDANVANDFFYYCFTKSTKTLIAINVLIEERLGEDAQILIRAAYENYLAISFLVSNPDRLDDLVAKKVGAHTGYLQHPLTSRGRIDYRKVIDPDSGEKLPFGLSVAEMVSLGKYSEDREVHWPLYGFLSEHCHPHMMASGNYRDKTNLHYSYENKIQVLQAVVYATYIYVLLLDEARCFQQLKRPEAGKASKLIKAGIAIIKRALKILIFEQPMERLPNAISSRLELCSVMQRDV